MSVSPLYEHQVKTVEKQDGVEGFFDLSDPGTGKTRAHTEGFARRGGRLLVCAPKSILQPAWGGTIDTFFPGMTYSIANANNREKAFAEKTDVVITNHDAVTWILKNKKVLDGFTELIVDESTAFKNPQAQRSKAIKELSKHFKYRRNLSGTPNPNSILELWHQVYLLDRGQRLGDSYWRFRNAACEPVQVGPRREMVEWRDKPGIEAAVFDLLSDISIRHRFEDCVSIPPNVTRRIEFELPRKCRIAYDDMAENSLLLLENGEVVRAVHAASVATKLMQIASGALYTGEDEYAVLDDTRTELVMDLVEERSHTLVAFNWKHQRDQLVEAAKKRGFRFGVIDGEVKGDDRTEVVEQFQAGDLKVVFAHPQSAGHGLTLTKGVATIWTSPTYSAEHYKQFFHRIYRAGQVNQTETIQICAKDTIEERAYNMILEPKLSRMDLFLSLMEAA